MDSKINIMRNSFTKVTFSWLIAGLSLVGITVASVSLIMLYKTAYSEKLNGLAHSASTLASLIESVTQFNQRYSVNDHEYGARGSTMSQLEQGLRDYHKTYHNKELIIGWQEGENVIIMQRNKLSDGVENISFAKGYDMESPALTLALQGKYGSGEFFDFRGRRVLAGYAPVPSLHSGVVYKVGLDEVQADYIQTSYRVGMVTLFLVFGGAVGFSFFVMPIQARADAATAQVMQQQKQLQESEGRLRQVIDATNDGIWDWEFVSDTVKLSPRCEDILGYPERIIKHSKQILFERIHPEDSDRLSAAVKLHFDVCEPFQIDLRLRHNAGDYRWVLVRGEAVRDEHGKVMRMLGTITDISARKQAEEELDRYRQHLEEIVDERTRALQQIQNQLLESEKMATLVALVAGVAHELNTPVGISMTAISHWQVKLEAYAKSYHESTLSREDFESLLSIAAESSKIIRSNIERASELVRSFKQVAVDQASNDLRQFNLLEYLHEILLSMRPKLKQGDYQVDIDCPEDIVLFSHPGGLSQIITNLVMNSLIHGFADSREGNMLIQVNELSMDRIAIDYHDDGKGIPSENLPRIFDRFYTTRRGQGGSGLGMHIVFSLVTQTLGGSITCHSVEGQGTSFRIVIPKQAETIEELQMKKAQGA